MQQPLVTIGIPVYNVGRFIGLTLNSVLAQTYTNFELIITDDGSTDNTVEVIRSFNDPRIHLIVDGENHGISYRLNQQIALAKGKYFIRMDGDDLMFPDRVERQVRYLEENPEVDVVGAGAVIIDDDNQIIGQRQSLLKCTRPEDIINNIPFIHPTVCGRITFFRKYHYDEMLSGVEDKDLWCRGIIDNKYAVIEQPLMFYRDPLKFKLKTYLYRKKQGRRMIFLRMHLFKNKRPAYKYILDSWIKSIVAFILSILGIESTFIGQRNRRVRRTEAYDSILNDILKK